MPAFLTREAKPGELIKAPLVASDPGSLSLCNSERKKPIMLAKLRARATKMKHFFMEIDGMTVTYGDIVKGRLCDAVPYYVERDNGEGDFDFAQGSLPTCTPVKSKGFAESELWDIESFMRDNMHNIYDQIRGEGAWA